MKQHTMRSDVLKAEGGFSLAQVWVYWSTPEPSVTSQSSLCLSEHVTSWSHKQRRGAEQPAVSVCVCTSLSADQSQHVTQEIFRLFFLTHKHTDVFSLMARSNQVASACNLIMVTFYWSRFRYACKGPAVRNQQTYSFSIIPQLHYIN